MADHGPRLSIIVSCTPHMRVEEIAGALCAQSVPIAGNEFLVVDGTRSRAVRRRIAQAAATLHGRVDFRVIET